MPSIIPLFFIFLAELSSVFFLPLFFFRLLLFSFWLCSVSSHDVSPVLVFFY